MARHTRRNLVGTEGEGTATVDPAKTNRKVRYRILLLVAGTLAVFAALSAWEGIGALRTIGGSAQAHGLGTPHAKTVTAKASTAITGPSASPAATVSPGPVTANAVPSGSSTTASAPAWVAPVPGEVVLGFGWAYSSILGDWQLHTGVDLAAEVGEQAVAPAAGKVVSVRQDPLWGWVVSIVLPDQIYSTNVSALESAQVKVGQQVKAGQAIGLVGPAPPAEANLGPHVFWQTFDGVDPVAPSSSA